jgi:hypothetical protein
VKVHLIGTLVCAKQQSQHEICEIIDYCTESDTKTCLEKSVKGKGADNCTEDDWGKGIACDQYRRKQAKRIPNVDIQ